MFQDEADAQTDEHEKAVEQHMGDALCALFGFLAKTPQFSPVTQAITRGHEARLASGLLQAMEKRNKIRKSIEVCFEASHSHVSGTGIWS